MAENLTSHSVLTSAKTAKNDEFYTQLADIEQEMTHYRQHFYGKTIFLNCDDPETSYFWVYFSLNFDFLGLKSLISTHYVEDIEKNGPAYMLRLDAQKGTNQERITKKNLKENGDFRSDECIELLKEADIVITNPPFSLFREFTNQLIEYKKQFIIIGNKNAVTYKEIFPLLKENKVWIGHRNMNRDFWFIVAENYKAEKIDKNGNRIKHIMACWYTNLDIDKRHEELVLTNFYEGNEEKYPFFDNYNAININKVKDIPMDFTGVMGVPITFLDKYSPDQFEILGMTKTPICNDNNIGAERIKTYSNVIQIKEGVQSSGNKINDGSALLYKEVPTTPIYYIAENLNGYLVAQYPRILIKNKRAVSKKEMLS